MNSTVGVATLFLDGAVLVADLPEQDLCELSPLIWARVFGVEEAGDHLVREIRGHNLAGLALREIVHVIEATGARIAEEQADNWRRIAEPDEPAPHFAVLVAGFARLPFVVHVLWGLDRTSREIIQLGPSLRMSPRDLMVLAVDPDSKQRIIEETSAAALEAPYWEQNSDGPVNGHIGHILQGVITGVRAAAERDEWIGSELAWAVLRRGYAPATGGRHLLIEAEAS